MHATVIKVHCDSLLVCDQATSQEVLVYTEQACCFQPCDHVCIRYSGAMTMSIPPQISAECITKLTGCC